MTPIDTLNTCSDADIALALCERTNYGLNLSAVDDTSLLILLSALQDEVESRGLLA